MCSIPLPLCQHHSPRTRCPQNLQRQWTHRSVYAETTGRRWDLDSLLVVGVLPAFKCGLSTTTPTANDGIFFRISRQEKPIAGSPSLSTKYIRSPSSFCIVVFASLLPLTPTVVPINRSRHRHHHRRRGAVWWGPPPEVLQLYKDKAVFAFSVGSIRRFPPTFQYIERATKHRTEEHRYYLIWETRR